MKKILIFANDTTYTYNLRDSLIKCFIAKGFEVIVICECLKYNKEIHELGARIIELKMNRRSTNPFSDLTLLNKFRKIIKNEKPFVVLTYNIKPNVYGGLACRMTGTPYISNVTGLGTSINNPGLMQKFSMILYKAGIKKASCVMFQNEENKRFFQEKKLMKANAHTCLLPGSGVNLEKFSLQPYPNDNSPILFSIIGRIMKDKGTDELLEAIRYVKNKYPAVVFRMIGYFDDDYQTKVNAAVSEGLIEYVKEQENIKPYLQASWAVIQPSHHEGMSNVLLESAATGRPVIASDIPGCRETFDDNISGLAFPVGDAKALAERIIHFIELPYGIKLQMGRAGRVKMESHFDRNIVAGKYMDEISRLEEKI